MNVEATSISKDMRIGAGSDFIRFQRIDGRSELGRLLRAILRELVDHLGCPGQVTAPMRLLIERVATDIVRLELLDYEMLTGGFSEHDQRVADALRNSVRLALREVGFAKRAPPVRSIADVVAEIGRKSAA